MSFLFLRLGDQERLGITEMERVDWEWISITELFGTNVFSVSVMRERLPKKVFAEVTNVMENGGSMSMSTADVVAAAMKDWAVSKGATHYTHWFQPLTGSHGGKARLASLTRPAWTARRCFS